MSTDDSTVNPVVTRRSVWLDFLGSMNLAITILVIIAIASVIGTVLQQNQPYNNYIIKFGPFWHEFFLSLNLYDVYSASWFLVLLFFLVLSTSVCIYRNTPTMLQEMRNFRLNSKLKSLKLIEGAQSWTLKGEDKDYLESIRHFFQQHGYQVRIKQHEDRTLIAAMRGRWNRLGYIFAHLGILVLLLGGMMDSTLDIWFKEIFGKLKIDTKSEYVKDMGAESQLQPNDLLSFRGNVSISEGQSANFALLHVRDGSLVQHLPFAITLKDFRVEHYETGQPKSFESDLVIIDKDKGKPFETTIAVNHPLEYRGYTIYQASFGDGGSTMNLKIWPFFDKQMRAFTIDGIIRGSRTLNVSSGAMTLEFEDFKKFNVFPAQEGDARGKKFVNYGPSLVFKLRDKSGQAREYSNLMSPVQQNGQYVFITGMRATPSEPFRYIHIPADDKFTIDRFMRLHALMNDAEQAQAIATRTVAEVLQDAPAQDKQKYQQNLIKTMMDLLDRFNFGGYAAIEQHVRELQSDEAQRVRMREAFQKVFNSLMQALYLDTLQKEGVDISQPLTEAQQSFYLYALEALRQVPLYGSPFYVQLVNFQHVESSGLSIAKLPGKNVFYFGSVMSILGIFLLLYLSQQRLWAMLHRDEAGQLQLVFAGSGSRNTADFRRHYSAMATGMAAVIHDETTTAEEKSRLVVQVPRQKMAIIGGVLAAMAVEFFAAPFSADAEVNLIQSIKYSGGAMVFGAILGYLLASWYERWINSKTITVENEHGDESGQH